MKSMTRVTAGLILLVLIWLSNAMAAEVALFGPHLIERGTGKPVSETHTFSVPDPTGPFTLQIKTGDDDGNHRISSLSLSINGEKQASQDDFNQTVNRVEKSVALQSENSLAIKVNGAPGSFVEMTDSAGSAFGQLEVSRGAAFGDLDNDGDTDIVVHNNAGPARLLINQVGQDRAWLGLEVRTGAGAGRDALGAWVEAIRTDGSRLARRVRTDGSYASAHDSRLLLGLGDGPPLDRLRVSWPDGRVEEWPAPEPRQYVPLRHGSGTPIEGTSR